MLVKTLIANTIVCLSNKNTKASIFEICQNSGGAATNKNKLARRFVLYPLSNIISKKSLRNIHNNYVRREVIHIVADVVI